jgi:hypothetical protein
MAMIYYQVMGASFLFVGFVGMFLRRA